jgi:indoleamine 2,3-dioxygenase
MSTGCLCREKCDPYIYYARVRQPMSGWRNNPALPQGLTYEGVAPQEHLHLDITAGGAAYWHGGGGSGDGALRLQLYGETGAQSSVVPAFDIALGVEHEKGW